MKRNYYLIIASSILFIITFAVNAISSPTLYDDFSGSYIDSSNWRDQELVREVVNGKLVSISATDSGRFRNYTQLRNSASVYAIQADVTPVASNLGGGSNVTSLIRVEGQFFNTRASGGITGDVWAALRIVDRGSGLEANYVVVEAESDDWSTYTVLASDTIKSGLSYTETYTLTVEYDDVEHEIIFTLSGETPVTIDNTILPAYARPAVDPGKYLTTGFDNAESGVNFVHATFDNVYINNQGTVYDDFSTAPLDQTKWQSLSTVRKIENGKLRLATQSNGDRENTRINFVKPPKYTEGIVTIKSDSIINAGTKGRTRISGEFYNDTYGPGEYNGYEGDIYAQVYIDHYDNNTLEAKCYVEKATNADWSTYQELYFHAFSLPIDFDKPYKLSIHFKGSSFVFKVIDIGTSTEEFYEYQVTTTVNRASQPNVQIISRVYGNGSSGYMSVEWDDVYVDTVAAPATYDATGDWDITPSNEWADGSCSLPNNSPGTGKITQTVNDVTLVVGGTETLTGWVFSNNYYLTQTLIDPNKTEVFYVRLNLSNATTGSGTVVIEQTEGDDVCYKGFDIAFSKTSDAPDGDDGDDGGGGGGGGGCFISTLIK